MGTLTGDASVALERLRQAGSVLITCHLNPDGDAIGSELAFAELARRLGARVRIINRDPAPVGLDELPGAEAIEVGEMPAMSDFDLVTTMECPELDRSGFEAELSGSAILNIDHHKGNDRYGEIDFLDTGAPAVGEMVSRMFDEAGLVPSAEAATAIYTAITTDTGDFRYPNTNVVALSTAARMVELGADPAGIAELVHHRKSLASLRLVALAMETLELSSADRIATLGVDPERIHRSGADGVDSEHLLAMPRSIQGVLIVGLLKQVVPGTTRVSLRSKGDLDVRRVAVSYGGGGHTNAAGCAIPMDFEEARLDLLSRLETLFEENCT